MNQCGKNNPMDCSPSRVLFHGHGTGTTQLDPPPQKAVGNLAEECSAETNAALRHAVSRRLMPKLVIQPDGASIVAGEDHHRFDMVVLPAGTPGGAG